jgi:hypothetical protein
MNNESVAVVVRFSALGAGIGLIAGNWQKGAMIGAVVGLISVYGRGNA